MLAAGTSALLHHLWSKSEVEKPTKRPLLFLGMNDSVVILTREHLLPKLDRLKQMLPWSQLRVGVAKRKTKVQYNEQDNRQMKQTRN